MKLKVGDILICKKNYYWNKSILFEKGNRCYVRSIFHGTIFVSNYIDYNDGDYFSIGYNVCEYFYTDKEVRKLKLNEINK